MIPTGDEALRAAVMTALRTYPAAAAFVSQLPRHPHLTTTTTPALESAVRQLAVGGEALVTAHIPPDAHLAGADLRIIAAMGADEEDAIVRSNALWNAWVAEFLANHICE
jgi:putative NIF3 family GTP cyclohydrolase 1 type 2